LRFLLKLRLQCQQLQVRWTVVTVEIAATAGIAATVEIAIATAGIAATVEIAATAGIAATVEIAVATAGIAATVEIDGTV